MGHLVKKSLIFPGKTASRPFSAFTNCTHVPVPAARSSEKNCQEIFAAERAGVGSLWLQRVFRMESLFVPKTPDPGRKRYNVRVPRIRIQQNPQETRHEIAADCFRRPASRPRRDRKSVV